MLSLASTLLNRLTEPILPLSCVMGAISWEIVAVITEAHCSQPISGMLIYLGLKFPVCSTTGMSPSMAALGFPPPFCLTVTVPPLYSQLNFSKTSFCAPVQVALSHRNSRSSGTSCFSVPWHTSRHCFWMGVHSFPLKCRRLPTRLWGASTTWSENAG